MSIRQVGILIFFSILACPLDAPKRRSLANLATPAAKPTLILIAGGASRTASLRTASKTKALRIIFAGKLGSTPAVITLLTANNRNVFISLRIALMRANLAAAVGGVIAAAAGTDPVRHSPGRRKNTAPA